MSWLKKRDKKLLIIGLDGVPYGLIRSFTSEPPLMPHLKEILTQGKLVPMSVSLPEISSVSWSSFMTGTDSGHHGIFGFVDLKEGQYEYRYPNFRDLAAPAFFDQLGEKGKRSVVINLPGTFPVREIPGILISGFVSLDLKRSVYPFTYYPLIKKMGYKVDVDAELGRSKKAEFLADLHYTLKVRAEVADFFWQNQQWDCFMLTVTGTDRLHHFLYDALADKCHPFHQDFLNFYRQVDEVIGDLYSRMRGKEEFEIILLSDHGFGPVEREVYLNPILKAAGFFDLQVPPGKADSLTAIDDRSLAFAVDPSRIFIHLKDKYPRGRVEHGDYTRVREDIKQLFEEYEIDGKRVIKRVFFKEEIYGERFLSRAADIVLLSHHGFDLKGGLQKNREFGHSHLTGMHLQDNAFFFTTRPEYIPAQMTIFDVKDIILKLLQVKF